MTSPKPLLPAPPKRTFYKNANVTGVVVDAAYADWLLDVATRAMGYARHDHHCCHRSIEHYKVTNPPCDCGLDELRAAIDKARG